MMECGCKGARFCDLCKNSERVKNLQCVPTQSIQERFQDYKRMIFCGECGVGWTSEALNNASIENGAELEKLAVHPEHPSGEKIEGLLLVKDFISESEEAELVADIDTIPWVQSQSGRRKQDYGPKVNFKKRKVRVADFQGLPSYADNLLEKMRSVGLTDYDPLELCNLEYEPSKGSCIDFHIDDTWIWGPRLISINLLSGSVMAFTRDSLLLFAVMPRRSLLSMFGAIRYDWKHGILKEHVTERRIALTMREPAAEFRPGGALHESVGAELSERGRRRMGKGVF